MDPYIWWIYQTRKLGLLLSLFRLCNTHTYIRCSDRPLAFRQPLTSNANALIPLQWPHDTFNHPILYSLQPLYGENQGCLNVHQSQRETNIKQIYFLKAILSAFQGSLTTRTIKNYNIKKDGRRIWHIQVRSIMIVVPYLKLTRW